MSCLLINSWLSAASFHLRTGQIIQIGREKIMFTIPPNTILLICAAIVGAIIGFLIYGCIKGFRNIFPDA